MLKLETHLENLGNKRITPEQARHSIYIDFEGLGKSPKNPVPMPHMLGTFRPKKADIKALYKAYLFQSGWQPLANGAGKIAIVGDLADTVGNLVEKVRQSGGYLVYFSDHERKVIKTHCPRLYGEFIEVGFNAYPPLKQMFNKTRGKQKVKERPRSLADYMNLYHPKSQCNDAIKLTKGAADSCRKIDGYALKNTHWGNWKDRQKAIALELLKYNEGDCRSTWKLTKKLANHQSNI